MTQALIRFPGINATLGGVVTISSGPFASSALVYFVPQDRLELSRGDLTISYGTSTVTIPDCYPQSASLRMHRTCEGFIQSILISDRRKGWEDATVTGRYNTRRADGTKENEKDLQTLVSELMGAIGETSAVDTSALPSDVYPAVDWKGANVAFEVDKLCDDAACDIVVNEYSTSIEGRGSGNSIPQLSSRRITPEYTFATSSGPENFRVIGGPVVVDGWIKLEAVGEELDGTILPISELSYMQGVDLEKQHPFLMQGVDASARDQALKSVFRWYRVKSMVDDSLSIPGAGSVSSPSQIKVLGYRAEVNADGDPAAAYTDAKYWNRTEAYAASDEFDPIMTPFTIDKDLGIVKFDDFVCNLTSDGCFKEPEIYLRTAFNLEDDEGQIIRTTYTTNRNGLVIASPDPATTRSIYREELYEIIKLQYTATDTYANPNRQTNIGHVTTECNAWTTAMSSPYRLVRDQKTVVYEGIVPVTLDGRVTQVTYELSHLKSGEATTTVSENYEHDVHEHSRSDRVARREALR